jgi:ketosteroid isomerase-like protein
MSQENVETVRRFLEAGQRSLETYWRDPRAGTSASEFETGDLRRQTEKVLAFLHPDCEVNVVGEILFGGPVRGHLGWLKLWDEVLAVSERYSTSVGELGDLGGGVVLAVGTLAVKWKESGMEQTETMCWLFTLREGLIVRIDSYRDRGEALAAIGLSEQDAHADS